MELKSISNSVKNRKGFREATRKSHLRVAFIGLMFFWIIYNTLVRSTHLSMSERVGFFILGTVSTVPITFILLKGSISNLSFLVYLVLYMQAFVYPSLTFSSGAFHMRFFYIEPVNIDKAIFLW